MVLSPNFGVDPRIRFEGLKVAEWTGLEPATSGVTGRRSNQLNYQTNSLNILVVLSFKARAKIIYIFLNHNILNKKR